MCFKSRVKKGVIEVKVAVMTASPQVIVNTFELT